MARAAVASPAEGAVEALAVLPAQVQTGHAKTDVSRPQEVGERITAPWQRFIRARGRLQLMPVPPSFAYVDPPDVPDGVTLDAYRRAGAPAPRRRALIAC